MSFLLRILAGSIGPYIVGALAALLVLLPLVGYGVGRHDGVQAEQRAEAGRLERARKVVVKREAAAQVVTEKVKAAVVTERVRVQTITKTLIREVPVYVTPASDARCVVPVGFVQLHDAAAAGVPRAAGGPVDAPSGVQLSAVLGTVVGNYGVAYDWRAEALGWRSWYVKQKKAWDKR